MRSFDAAPVAFSATRSCRQPPHRGLERRAAAGGGVFKMFSKIHLPRHRNVRLVRGYCQNACLSKQAAAGVPVRSTCEIPPGDAGIPQ